MRSVECTESLFDSEHQGPREWVLSEMANYDNYEQGSVSGLPTNLPESEGRF